MIFFWCKFGFGKCFAASSLFSHWAGCHLLSYKIHFSSHFTIRSRNGLLLCRIREGTAKWWLTVSLWRTHLPYFFTFPVCFKCQMTVERLTMSSLVTYPIVLRGSASMMALSVGHCHLPMASQCSPYLQGFRFLCITSWTSTALHSVAVPGPDALLILWVVSTALWPILNLNKITRIFFLSNIISTV